MVDWGGSSLQIVVAIIGSGLIVTGLTSLNSIVNNPLVHIDVEVKARFHGDNVTNEPSPNQYNVTTLPRGNYTTYIISLENNGNSPATDVRLTMTYPDAKIINFKPVLENENITFINQTSDSVAAEMPRLSAGTVVTVENTISGNLNLTGNIYADPDNAKNDFKLPIDNWVYLHSKPFSITVTHEEGAETYRPPDTSPISRYTSGFFNIELLKFYLPIVIAVLLFGIAFRGKRKSMSVSASDILKDIESVENHLQDDNSSAILSFKKDSPEGQKIRIFETYYEYDKVDDFYTGLNERESAISKAYLSNDSDNIHRILNEQNKRCLSLATSAHSSINWKKFYIFDLILFIPAILLGSSFISFICEGVPTWFHMQQHFEFVQSEQLQQLESQFHQHYQQYRQLEQQSTQLEQSQQLQQYLQLEQQHLQQLMESQQSMESQQNYYLLATIIIEFMTRSIGTYFILRWILLRTQGSSLTNYSIPALSRRRKFFAYCIVVMGVPTILIVGPLFSFLYPVIDLTYIRQLVYIIFFIAIDIGRMLLLTKIISHHPKTGKNKSNFLEIINGGKRETLF